MSSTPRPLEILLVSMPWRETNLPNAGLGLLKAVLNEAGHRAEVLDANLIVEAELGPVYHELAQYTISEVAFTPLVFDHYPAARAGELLAEHVRRMTQKRPGETGSPEGKDALSDLARGLPGRLDTVVDQLIAAVDWGSYDVIGMSTTFNQTMASAVLARRLRERFPQLLLIVGGAACDGPMGRAMLEIFPWYDATCVGRAEASITTLCEALARGQRDGSVPGTVVRRGDELFEAALPAPRVPLDSLPIPDYEDFFALGKRVGWHVSQPAVPMEASLGCWWGQKNLCTFCGLNANTLSFSQKSPERALREIRELGRRYAVDRIDFTDNILPLDYYDTVVPALAELAKTGERYEFFVEIKTNVKDRAQLRSLREAGFRFFQPGIESFSDGILDLMKKGNTALSQVQFLKWCDELRLGCIYNIIYSNPGETPEDYEAMSRLLPSLAHITPPVGDPYMQLQRFSPYFERPEQSGIHNVRPASAFCEIFPGVSEEVLGRLVYFFDYDHPDVDAPPLRAARRKVQALVARWKAVHQPELCTYTSGPGWVRIDDQREGAWFGTQKRSFFTLRGAQAALFLHLDQQRSPEQAAATLGISATEVLSMLEWLVQRRLVAFDGRKALALPTRALGRRVFATATSSGQRDVAPADPELAWRPGRALEARGRDRRKRLPLVAA